MIRETLTDVLSKNVKMFEADKKFLPAEIKVMVDYAMNDLETGEVLKHNTHAGQAADNLVFGPK